MSSTPKTGAGPRTHRPLRGWGPPLIALGIVGLLGCVAGGVWGARGLAFMGLHWDHLLHQQMHILVLDERLTNAARLAASTGNPRAVQTYEQSAAELDELMARSRDAGEALGVGHQRAYVEHLAEADVVNRRLIEIERRAIALGEQGQGERGAALLDGAEYMSHKTLYADAVRRAERVRDDRIEARMDAARTTVVACFAGAVFSVVLLGAICVLVIRGHRDRAVEMARRAEKARDEAERAARARTSFLANMSHEVRTPLTAIIGFSDALLDPRGRAEDRIHAATVVRRNAKHLLTIISDILEVAQIQSGAFEHNQAPADVARVLSRTRDTFANVAREKGVALSCEPARELPPLLLTDAARISQLLFHLVSNALKFTSAGGVRVRAAYDQAAARLTLEVSDDGIGIPPEHLERLFGPFEQADDGHTRRFGGAGLGLTLVRAVCHGLGGGVSASSQPGKGTTVTAWIPCQPHTAAQSATTHQHAPLAHALQPAPDAPIAHTPRVLVVEDGLDNQRLLSHYLRGMDVPFEIAANGEEGVRVALAARMAGKPFGLVVMDMQMPVLDGYEATRRLRDVGYDGQVIALTAHALPGEQRACLEAGCDAYLSKPIDRDQFTREVSTRLGLRSAWVPTRAAQAA